MTIPEKRKNPVLRVFSERSAVRLLLNGLRLPADRCRTDGEFALWSGKDVAVVKRVIRILALGIGLVLVAVGGFALASAYMADHTAVMKLRLSVESGLLDGSWPITFQREPV